MITKEEAKEIWDTLWTFDLELIKLLHNECVTKSRINFEETDKGYLKANMIQELFSVILTKLDKW